MHEGNALICKLKYAEICMKYAAICSTKYAGICTNMLIRNMQNVCIISSNLLKYANSDMHTSKYAFSKFA